jgi:hypothetical protein
MDQKYFGGKKVKSGLKYLTMISYWMPQVVTNGNPTNVSNK